MQDARNQQDVSVVATNGFSPKGAQIWMIVLLLLVTACQRQPAHLVVVQGTMEGTAGMLWLLEQKTFELQKIDSVTPDTGGTFRICIPSSGTNIFALRNTAGDQAVFIATAGDSISVSGRLDLFPPEFRVSGNKESELLQTFYDYSYGNLRKVDSLQVLIERNQGEEGFYELTVRVNSLFNQIWEAQRAYEKDFIHDHAGAFATLLVVNYHFGVRPVLSVKTDAADYRRVDSGLMAAYPGNKHTLFFHQWLKEMK
ncbi:MAG: hypothetical protein D4R67_13200 [Bacteroidetes bacterium]|nr:MAG: hypothetical protein D4R67_13200 [Bacteroidota bacterium]